MDSLINYCSGGDTFEYNGESQEQLSSTTKYDSGHSTDLASPETLDILKENKQLKQRLEDCQQLLKHNLSKLNFHQDQMEGIEEEYNRLLESLSAAEKNNFELKCIIAKHEATIASLKAELETFNDLEKRQNLSITGEKLSFSDGSSSNSSNGSKHKNNALTPFGENAQILMKFQNMCSENDNLKKMNESLNEELRLLKKDNQDYENYMFRGPPDFARAASQAVNNFAISTPIKKGNHVPQKIPPKVPNNYISYKDLDLSLAEYSIDGDEEHLQQQQPANNFKTPAAKGKLGLLLNKFESRNLSNIKPVDCEARSVVSCKSEFNRLPIQECPNLVEESMPHCSVNCTVMTPARQLEQIDELFAETPVPSIEEEMMPFVDLSSSTANVTSSDSKAPSTAVSTTSTATSKEECTKILVKPDEPPTLELEEPEIVSTTSSSTEEKMKQSLEKKESKSFPGLYSRVIWLMIMLVLITIMLWSKQHTRLLPYYSLEEILTDLWIQYTYTR